MQRAGLLVRGLLCGVKFVQKEDITPRAADRWVFRLAPAVALIPYLLAMATIPIHPGVAAVDVPGSLVLVLAATSVGALGTLMAGWASANKYALNIRFIRQGLELRQRHPDTTVDVPFDIVFCDPPYGKGLAEAAIGSALAGGWLAGEALVVVEESAAASERADASTTEIAGT